MPNQSLPTTALEANRTWFRGLWGSRSSDACSSAYWLLASIDPDSGVPPPGSKAALLYLGASAHCLLCILQASSSSPASSAWVALLRLTFKLSKRKGPVLLVTGVLWGLSHGLLVDLQPALVGLVARSCSKIAGSSSQFSSKGAPHG